MGRFTGVAAPVPVMLGPVRCIGTCGPEPSAKHPYGKELVSEMSSLAETTTTTTSRSTSTTGNTTTTTTTTTTATTKQLGENSPVAFAAPVMSPLVKRPFSKRAVVQLSSVDLGRALDTKGAGTNTQTSLIRLLVSGVGYSYVLPAPLPTPPPEASTPIPVLPAESTPNPPTTNKKKP
jgi:hypothetical protein